MQKDLMTYIIYRRQLILDLVIGRPVAETQSPGEKEANDIRQIVIKTDRNYSYLTLETINCTDNQQSSKKYF